MRNSIHDAIAVSTSVGWPGGLTVCYREKPAAGNTTSWAHPQKTCPVQNQYIMASSTIGMKSDHQAQISFSLLENVNIRSDQPFAPFYGERIDVEGRETVRGSVFVDRRTRACLLELENWNFSLAGRLHCGNYKTYWHPRSVIYVSSYL